MVKLGLSGKRIGALVLQISLYPHAAGMECWPLPCRPHIGGSDLTQEAVVGFFCFHVLMELPEVLSRLVGNYVALAQGTPILSGYRFRTGAEEGCSTHNSSVVTV